MNIILFQRFYVLSISSHRAGHFDFTVTATGRNNFVLGATVAQGTQNAFTVRLIAAG
jgi:hypothetical protein